MNRDLKGMKIFEEGLVHTRDTASAKALRWECIWNVFGTVRRLVGWSRVSKGRVGDVSGFQN